MDINGNYVEEDIILSSEDFLDFPVMIQDFIFLSQLEAAVDHYFVNGQYRANDPTHYQYRRLLVETFNFFKKLHLKMHYLKNNRPQTRNVCHAKMLCEKRIARAKRIMRKLLYPTRYFT